MGQTTKTTYVAKFGKGGFSEKVFNTLDDALEEIENTRVHDGEYEKYWNDVADDMTIVKRVTVEEEVDLGRIVDTIRLFPKDRNIEIEFKNGRVERRAYNTLEYAKKEYEALRAKLNKEL